MSIARFCWTHRGPSALVAASVLGSACSLALDLAGRIPCEDATDCQYALGQGICNAGFCQPPTGLAESDGTGSTGLPDPTTGPAPTTQGETTIAATTDSGGSESGTTTGVTPCTLNSECTTDELCGPGGICIDLLTSECQIVRWPSNGERDDVVFVGSIMPTGEPFTALVEPLQNAVQLAISDFNGKTSLQGDRKIAWVGCDDTGGVAASEAAAAHLIDEVGVPAIVGPVFSEAVLAVSDLTVPAGVFLITPSATAMSIAGLDDMDLVWRTIPGDIYQSNALVDRFLDLNNEGVGGNVTNLLILAKDDAHGSGLLASILASLGTSLPVVTRPYPNPTSFASMQEMLAAYGEVLASAAGQGPYSHVLFLGTSEIQVLLYSYLGIVWDPMTEPMPLFTVSHGAVTELERFINEIGTAPGTAALVPLKPAIEAHLQGTTPIVLNQNNFNSFTIRYNIAFNDPAPLTSAALSYDAAMSTLFAMSTVPAETAVTGAAIAAAMPRLTDPGGTRVSFSGSDLAFITTARNTLVIPEGSVDLEGVSGELQWQLDTGDVRAGVWGWDVTDTSPDGSMPVAAPARIYCLAAEPSNAGTWQSITLPCPAPNK